MHSSVRIKLTACLALLLLAPVVTVARYIDEVSQELAADDYQTSPNWNGFSANPEGEVKSFDDENEDQSAVGLFDAPISSDEDLMAESKTLVRNADGTFGLDWTEVAKFGQGLVKAAMPYVINEIVSRVVPPMIRSVFDFFRQARLDFMRMLRIDPESAPPGLIDRIDVDQAVEGGVNMVRTAMNSAAALVGPRPAPPPKPANPFGDVLGGLFNSMVSNALQSAVSGKGGFSLSPKSGDQAADLLKMVQSVFQS